MMSGAAPLPRWLPWIYVAGSCQPCLIIAEKEGVKKRKGSDPFQQQTPFQQGADVMPTTLKTAAESYTAHDPVAITTCAQASTSSTYQEVGEVADAPRLQVLERDPIIRF